MGQLVSGVWTKSSVSNNQKDGSFKRVDSVFRNEISVNGQVYKPETNRYHLYVSYACPWAHRVLIMRELKDLKDKMLSWYQETCDVVPLKGDERDFN